MASSRLAPLFPRSAARVSSAIRAAPFQRHSFLQRSPYSILNRNIHRTIINHPQPSAQTESRRTFHQSSTRHDREQKQRDEEEDETNKDRQESQSETKQSLGARLKDLSKRYGYAAVAVYLGLSAIDFPLCFLAVRTVGAERIGMWEQAVVDYSKQLIGKVIPGVGPAPADDAGDVAVETAPVSTIENRVETSLVGDESRIFAEAVEGYNADGSREDKSGTL